MNTLGVVAVVVAGCLSLRGRRGEEKERQGPKKDETNPRWCDRQNPFVPAR